MLNSKNCKSNNGVVNDKLLNLLFTLSCMQVELFALNSLVKRPCTCLHLADVISEV